MLRLHQKRCKLITKVYWLLNTAVDCAWSGWTNGECSVTCGTGVRKDTRSKTIFEVHGGKCSGKSIRTEICELRPCDDSLEYPDTEGSGEEIIATSSTPSSRVKLGIYY